MAVMTAKEVETLVVVLAEGGSARFEDLGATLWRLRRTPSREAACELGRRRAAPLVAAGALHKAVRGSVGLTEKGRIAAALLVARDPHLRDLFDDGPGQAR